MPTTPLRAIAIALLLSAPMTARAAGPAKTGAETKPEKAAKAAGVNVTVSQAGLDGDTNFIKIVGEIRNDTPDTIHSVRFGVTLLDAKGGRLKVNSILTATAKDLGDSDSDDWIRATRNYIPPGEIAVFHYLRDAKKVGGAYGSYKLGKPTFKVSSAAKAPKVVVEGFASPKDADGMGFDLTGTIKNAGKTVCREPEVKLGLYDASGRLLGATEVLLVEPDETYLKELAPGKSFAFRRHLVDEARVLEKPVENEIGSIKAWGDCWPDD